MVSTAGLFLDGTAHSNQTAWYLLASASAVAVLGACLLIAGRARTLVQPLVPLGQVALSAYLAHLFVGEVLVFPWLRSTQPPLVAQVVVAAAVFAALAAAGSAWLAAHRRGPVETVVRALAR